MEGIGSIRGKYAPPKNIREVIWGLRVGLMVVVPILGDGKVAIPPPPWAEFGYRGSYHGKDKMGSSVWIISLEGCTDQPYLLDYRPPLICSMEVFLGGEWSNSF